jgi:hypothetical protein
MHFWGVVGDLTAEDVEWLFRSKYRNVLGWSAKRTIRQVSKLNSLRFGEVKSIFVDHGKTLRPAHFLSTRSNNLVKEPSRSVLKLN